MWGDGQLKVTLRELTGELIRAVPMDKSHIQGLYEAANDENIWAHLPKTIRTLHDMEAFVEEALQAKDSGAECPFVIIQRETGKIVGTTRFLYMSSAARSLEIGWGRGFTLQCGAPRSTLNANICCYNIALNS